MRIGPDVRVSGTRCSVVGQLYSMPTQGTQVENSRVNSSEGCLDLQYNETLSWDKFKPHVLHLAKGRLRTT